MLRWAQNHHFHHSTFSSEKMACHAPRAMAPLFTQPDTASSTPRQIRFVHNQGQPPSKRRRINAACLTCRRRKTRCAGERPHCSTCTKNGHRCLGYPEESKRDSRNDEDEDAQADSPSSSDASSDEKSGKPDSPENETRRRKRTPSPLQVTQPPRKLSPQLSEPAIHQQPQEAHISPAMSASHPLPPGSTTTLDDLPASPSLSRTQNLAHRIPYFRYFGPTAIVPGFKQMVVSVREQRRSAGSHSITSPSPNLSTIRAAYSVDGSSEVAVAEDLPSYDPNTSNPVHPLIIDLVKTFFLHVGCNYPFLKEAKFVQSVKDKTAEPILVDAVCALAARFSDAPALTGGNVNMPRTERGQVFAQRAKHATVDTFPCPSVAAVQACLLMAYEGFGANQDSALWMYLGLAIRMAVDLGLQKRVGVKYQGEKDPSNPRTRGRGSVDPESPEEQRRSENDITIAEQKEVEQERIDTFWAVFVLDRVISSGTGRPVTFRDDDFDVPFPEQTIDSATGWPALFPILVQIIHLYGRASDVLNNIQTADDLTQEKWAKLTAMEQQLTKLYKNWDARLQFNVDNFKAYLGLGQGNIFILLHFWFHALFIILHQPTLLTPFGALRSELQLLSDSRELSMSSAKTICDILAFADLIDSKSFIGNPFTSQPIYIAAGAFLMESSATASHEAVTQMSPPPATDSGKGAKNSRHSLLASAANQNYQRCYNSLQQIHNYWGGIKYILTALDQKAKGVWDVETYTVEEYESTKAERRARGSISGQLARFENHGSPMTTGAPIAWSLAGTAYSPNSNLTLMYQNANGSMAAGVMKYPHAQPRDSDTNDGNMAYDPIRQSLPDSARSMFPPALPQHATSAMRHSPLNTSNGLTGLHGAPNGGPIAENGEANKMFMPGYNPSSQHSFDAYSASPTSTMADANAAAADNSIYYNSPMTGFPPNSWSAMVGNPDAITFNSHDVDIGSLGLQQPDIMAGWLDYMPNDVIGMFENPTPRSQ